MTWVRAEGNAADCAALVGARVLAEAVLDVSPTDFPAAGDQA